MSMDGYEVVYLTGAPAAGKSTTANALRARIEPLTIFEYGQSAFWQRWPACEPARAAI